MAGKQEACTTLRRVLRAALAGMAVMLVASAPGASARAAPRALVAPGTELRVVVLPIAQPGERVPSRRQLERTMRRTRAWLSRSTYGRIRLAYAIAPQVARPRPAPEVGIARYALRRAAARGMDVAGAIPVLIEATRKPEHSYGSPGQVQIRGTSWKYVDTVVHELGHALGLDHARAPTVCPRPFRPLRCADRPRNDYEYGDVLDVMGIGGDRYGAFGLAVLGLAPVRDAAFGRAVTSLRPLDGRRPTLLRLRTASRDYFADTRRRGHARRDRPVRAPRGVALSRARARYTPDGALYPHSQRIPASDPRRPCFAGSSACLGRQIFGPGRSFTVPGAFRLRVLRGGGPVRVATTWLDRTPPELAVTGAHVLRPAGGAPELVLGVRAAANGAGVLRVEVDQGGAVTHVDADGVRGLVAGRRGRGAVRVPLGSAPVARVRLRDAAGNPSAPIDVDLVTIGSRPGATVSWDPPLSPAPLTATALRAGQVVTMSGRTDPALAGAFVDFEAIGTDAPSPEIRVAPDGTFSTTWSAPEAGGYILRAHVPVGRAANGIDYVTQTFEGHLRG